MDNSLNEPKLNSKQRQYVDKLHKSSSILSVAAILLTIALFVRIETVARDTKTIDSKFTQQIQQIQDALRETVTQQAREKEDHDIAQGNRYKRSVVRRSLPATLNNNDQLNDSVGIKDIRDVIKRYVTSIIVGSVCLAPGKVCVAGPPGSKGVPGRPGKRGTRGIKGRKGTQGVMGPPGEPGKHGMMGDTGAPGVRGEKGNAGTPGHPGPKGEPGESISAPEVIVSPASLTVTQHQTATFYCSAGGNPKPTVSWSGAGLVDKDGQDNKLEIKNTAYNDSGKYVCTATNVLGQVQKEVKLLVEVPPRFTEIPYQVIKVKENTVASVVCRAFGFPPPVIHWSKAFAQLPQGRATVENGTLKISSFSLKDVGTYQCTATNKLGSVGASTTLSYIGACPDGWVRHENSCFFIIDTPTLKWNDAQRTCQDFEADLAIIRSATENTFLFNLIRKQKKVTEWGVWLGLYRKTDNKFYWVDDTPLVGQFSAWVKGEPNSHLEKCAHLYGKGNRQGKWNDIVCNCDARYLNYAPVVVCQKKVT